VRIAYAIAGTLLAGGTAATILLQEPGGAQSGQNSQALSAAAPRPGAPLSFADLAARLQPAVVNVSTTQRVQVGGFPMGTPFDELFRQFGGARVGPDGKPITREATSLGSGFVISADGYVVTNNHVVTGGGDGRSPVESITVTLSDRKEYKARLVGRDQLLDLALLKIEAKGLPFVTFGDSRGARVGDWVVAIGNPFGLGGTVTAGIISALHRNIGAGQYDRYIQTDASINQGNSGGPMFDLTGSVIGINTAIFSPTGGNVGIGFAIPAEQAKPAIDALMKTGRVRRGYLGVGIQPVSDDIAASLGLQPNRGEIVARVEPGYAAAKAGIRQGDVIVAIDGQEVTPDNTLSYVVANAPIGSRVAIDLIRNGKRERVTAVVGERPAEDQIAGSDDFTEDGAPTPRPGQAAQATLGLSLQALTPEIARQLRVGPDTRGVVIAAVDPSSDAAQQGLTRGDIILSINQQPVTTPEAAATAVAEVRKQRRDRVLLFVQRGNLPARYVAVKLAGN
jgi:serine protease Do